jgi:hypothetical protein
MDEPFSGAPGPGARRLDSRPAGSEGVFRESQSQAQAAGILSQEDGSLTEIIHEDKQRRKWQRLSLNRNGLEDLEGIPSAKAGVPGGVFPHS